LRPRRRRHRDHLFNLILSGDIRADTDDGAVFSLELSGDFLGLLGREVGDCHPGAEFEKAARERRAEHTSASRDEDDFAG